MRDKYYYLVASLPALKMGEAAPVSREAFLAECSKWMDMPDLERLSSTDINDLEIRPQDTEVTKEWKRFDMDFREELARLRKARKTSAHEKMPVFFKDVFEEPTPLLMEENLAAKRWSFLEQAEFGHHFDLEVLIIYFLRLQILERLAAFDREKGKARFESLCEVKYG